MPASVDWSASSSSPRERSPIGPPGAPPARAPRARGCPRRAACRDRTPRCPRTANSTRPVRARRDSWCTASSADCRRRSTSNPVAFAMSSAVAEQLREQLDVRRFAAAGAGAGVLEQRLEELRASCGRPSRRSRALDLRQIEEERVVLALGVAQRRLRLHVDRLVPRIGPVLGRADVHAQVAARAVLRRDLNRVQPVPLNSRPL